MGALKISLSIGGSEYKSTRGAGHPFALPEGSSGASEPTVVKVALPIDDSFTTGAIVDVITAVGSTISGMVVATREAVIDAEVVDD